MGSEEVIYRGSHRFLRLWFIGNKFVAITAISVKTPLWLICPNRGGGLSQSTILTLFFRLRRALKSFFTCFTALSRRRRKFLNTISLNRINMTDCCLMLDPVKIAKFSTSGGKSRLRKPPPLTLLPNRGYKGDFLNSGTTNFASWKILDYTRRARVAPKRLFVSGEPKSRKLMGDIF